MLHGKYVDMFMFSESRLQTGVVFIQTCDHDYVRYSAWYQSVTERIQQHTRAYCICTPFVDDTGLRDWRRRLAVDEMLNWAPQAGSAVSFLLLTGLILVYQTGPTSAFTVYSQLSGSKFTQVVELTAASLVIEVYMCHCV